MLSSLLNDPKCTLAPFVTAVNLNVPSYLRDPDIPPLIDELAQSLIDKCTSLTSLRLLGPGDAILPSFMDLSSSLTHLELVDGDLPGWGRQSSIQAGDILSLIGEFNALESLSMYYGVQGRVPICDPVDPIYDPRYTKLPPSLPRLRRLQLDAIWNVLLPWFLLPNVLSFPSLETLSLTLACSPAPLSVGVMLLQSFMDLYSSSAKDLTLYLTWRTIPGEICVVPLNWEPSTNSRSTSPFAEFTATLDFSRFTALRSISFRILGPSDEDGLKKLADIVSTCPNRRSANPLRVILTNDDVEPIAIEGIRWITDEKYFWERYDSSST
ncbi:hypothetical protein PQX77_013643 [Marasmius sp. AFHP31]|nr:hypothetical protein PQX77_013643 [Marasmius sp. AFHP31]